MGKAVMGGPWEDYGEVGPWTDYAPKRAPAAKPRGFLDEAKRQIGLGTRAAIGGLASVGDAAVMVANTPAYIGHALSGTPYAAPTPFGDMAARASNALGIGTPESDGERMASATVGGAASAIPFLMTGGASAAPTVGRMITEGVAGGASGAAGEFARQQGAGPIGQIAAALGGGLAGGVGAAGVNALAGRVTGAAPAASGRGMAEKIAAARLKQSMSDPARAAARLDEYGGSVAPGARPTLAEATGDQGVIALSRSMRNTARNGAGITQAMGDNTLARTSFIDDQFGPGSVDALNEAAAVALEKRGARVAGAIGKVGDSVPSEVAGMQARDKLASAADAAKKSARALYDNLPGGDEPLQVGPVDTFGAELPRPINTERAAFEGAAREGLKAGDSSRRATGGLTSFIVSYGGIKPSRVEQGFMERLPGVGDLYSAGVKPGQVRRGLFSQKGETLDNLLTAAQEAGFFPDNANPTVDDLVQMISDDVNGRPVYRQNDTRGLDRAVSNAEGDYWGQLFQRIDRSPDKMTDADWDMAYRESRDLPPLSMTESDAIEAAGKGQGAPISAAQSAVLDVRKRIMGVEPLGSGATDGLVRQFVNADKLASRDVEDIARRLHEQAGYAHGTREGAYATAAANAVDGFLRLAATPERLDALRQAQAAWREYSATFNRAGTPIATALRKDFGDFRQPDSTVGATLVPSGRKGAEYGERLGKAMGADAETLARTELRRAIDAAGERGADVRKVKAKYADTLRAYPALKADIDAAAETAALADAFRMSPMGKMADPSANASKVIGSVIANGDVGGFKQIAAFARTPEAKAGLRRSMANYIAKVSERGGGVAGADDAAGMTELQHVGKTIEALGKVLDIQKGSGALDPSQVAALNAVRGELSRANASTRLNAVVGSNTSRDAKTFADLAGSSIVQAVGRFTPGASVASAVLRVMRLAHMDKAEDLLVQALIDPALAKQLLARADEAKVRGVLGMVAARQAVLEGVPRSSVAANDVGAMTAAAAAAQDDKSQK